MKKVWDKWTRIALVKRILVGLILGAILGIESDHFSHPLKG